VTAGAFTLNHRFPLAALPTPLERAANLSAHLGIDLWIKRDDLTGLAMGGNKARKLEFVVADALAQGATLLLATAAAQSNFCRMTAAAAGRAGLRAGLLLRGSAEEPLQGNLLLNHLLGAEIRFIDIMDPYDPEHQRQLRAWAEEARERGEKPYVIDMHGGSRIGALVTCGYVTAEAELSSQCRAMGLRPDHLYLAVGSGSALAGLIVGATTPGSSIAATRLVGVSVSTSGDVLEPKVREFLDSTMSLLDTPTSAHQPTVCIDDTHRASGYGVPTVASHEAMRVAATHEALLLNPTYTSKAFAALLADIERGVIRRGKTVVFLNTGGDPLLFRQADALITPPQV